MSVARRLMDGAGWFNVRIKMCFFLALTMVGAPLTILVTGETLNRTELLDKLGLWAIVGLILLFPLSKLLTYLLVLFPIQQLNGLCLEIQKGNLNPFSEIPPEPAKQDELQKLRHNMFWMGHVIDCRQKEIRTAMEQLEDAQKQIQSSIDYAELIQKAFLPAQSDVAAVFKDSFLLWRQRDGVGGDSYWFKQTENGFFLGIIDCTGHGVPGAFMTLIVQSFLDRLDATKFEKNPAGVLTAVNKLIKKAFSSNGSSASPDDGMDCTFVYIDNEKTEMVFAGARNYLILRTPEGSLSEYKGDKKGVGMNKTPLEFEFTNQSIPVERGMRFYMLTDGLTDQVGGERRLPYGRKRFKAVISKNHNQMIEQQNELIEDFVAYQGEEKRRDDVLVFGGEL
ncbi:SpoIIE family protein phosphatase [Halodesulfovibrio sp.]|uniref:PP2C family protein-serine/threonine phosphatase n=1 Tax=Halodesulfovibrio sp. TaxID=1912772 RepID=UPI0025D29A2B|nr:SpoIIE family protein phosphatase [Halodesulfovibrio sp.]MCT4627285.1 SpoIIE family protein phosphatase [Halodesulfovibrio sp.]